MAPQSLCRYPRECWGSCLRHLPTAGVCDQRLGVSHRLLLTAGVCEQHLGGYYRLLLTAGVCEQYLILVLRPAHCQFMRPVSCTILLLLPITGVYNRLLGTVLRLLPTACHQHLDTSLTLLNFEFLNLEEFASYNWPVTFH